MKHTCTSPLGHLALQLGGVILWLWFGVRLMGHLTHGFTGSAAGSLLVMALSLYPGTSLLWAMLGGLCHEGRRGPRGLGALVHATIAGLILMRTTRNE